MNSKSTNRLSFSEWITRPQMLVALSTVLLSVCRLFISIYEASPQYKSNGFIIMNFGETKAHEAIIDSARSTLKKFGLRGLRADDKEYHDDLYGNVLTYMHGCSFGIAVFERLEDEYFNPNISLEVGYMRALDKSVCLLKDKTLKTLQTDLIGKPYKSFDPQAPSDSIPKQIEKWLRDKDILTV